MKKQLIFFFLFVWYSVYGQISQEHQLKIDSIKQVIKTSKEDSSIIEAYLAWNRIESQFDTSLKLMDKVEKLALDNLKRDLSREEIKFFKVKVASAKTNKAATYMRSGETQRALALLYEGLEILEAYGERRLVAGTLLNIGCFYSDIGDYETSIEYYNRSLKMSEEIEDKGLIALNLVNIGAFYSYVGNSHKALEAHFKTLEIFKELKSNYEAAMVLCNIGNVYFNLKDSEKSFEYCSKCQIEAERIGAENIVVIAQLGFVSLYRERAIVKQKQGSDPEEEFLIAKSYCKKALNQAKSINDKLGEVQSLNLLATLFMDEKNYKEATNIANQALSLSRTTKNLRAEEVATHTLYKAYNAIGEHKKALEMNQLYTQAKDSLNREKALYQIEMREIKKQYEGGLSVATSENKKQKNFILVFSISCAILTLLLGWLYNRHRNKSKASKLLLEEQKNKNRQQDSEIELKKKELAGLSMQVVRNSKTIDALSEELKTVDVLSEESMMKCIQRIKQQIKKGKSEEKHFSIFQKHFEEVHSEFMQKLKREHPGLTCSELRLCMLLKVNMHSNEISSLLGVSESSLKKYRHRIHSKMQLTKGEKLTDFILQYG